MGESGTNLAEITDMCLFCPYRTLLNDVIVTPEEVDNCLAANSDIQDTDCTAIRDGKCKLAIYAIDQQFNNIED